MKNSKLAIIGLVNALGVAVYVFIVSFIIRNGEKIFGEMKDVFGPVAFLLIFVFSAAITGGLVFGRPVMLYLESRKAEAVKLFFYTLGWLLIVILLIFAILALS